MDKQSKLAAELRAAQAAYRAIDRCGRPVLTVDRVAARERIAAAEAAIAADIADLAGRYEAEHHPLVLDTEESLR